MCIRDSLFFFFKQKTAYEIGVRLVGSEMCIRDRTVARNERPWDSFVESLYRKGGTFLERRRRTIAESRRVYVEIERRQIMGRDIQWGLVLYEWFPGTFL